MKLFEWRPELLRADLFQTRILLAWAALLRVYAIRSSQEKLMDLLALDACRRSLACRQSLPQCVLRADRQNTGRKAQFCETPPIGDIQTWACLQSRLAFCAGQAQAGV